MRLVPKLALTLLFGVFAVVAVFTAWRVKGEIETFDQDVRRDHRIVAVTAAAALAKTRTRQDAIRLAHRVDTSRERIRVRFVSLAPSPGPGLAPLVPLQPKDKPKPGAWTQFETERDEGRGPADYLLTYVGAPVVDEPQGAIELAESLESREAYISRGVWSVLASGVVMALVCGAIVVSIGARMVGRPVSELIDGARRIGEGDFDVFGAVARKDEFGELGRALRSMSSELATARARMLDEAEAKIRALEQLRHAERLATLGQLASVLAHEVGTPLNVIAGHAKMIATGRLAGDGARESGVAIGVQCDRMTQIVRRILDYARRRPPRRGRVEVSDVVQQARDLLSGLAQQRKVELVFRTTGEGLHLFADPDQLQQAIINLVMNAIQASAPGGRVRLSITGPTRGGADDDRQYVALAVEDHGEGIPEDARERIFEPFFTTKAPGEGTGLGLSVARDIVTEHGGFMEVDSHQGEGSTFRIWLPQGSEDVSASSCH